MAEAHAVDPVTYNLAEADKLKGLDKTGGDSMTAAHGGTGVTNHPDPAIGGVLDATVIVSIAMAVFIAILIWKRVPAMIVGGLDRQIASIRQRLDEAKTLRAEAEALRDEYARKIADIDAQAAAMIAHAEEEAAALVEKAKADAADLTARRARMAEDKIAAAERTAIAEIRAKVADAAAKAAATILAQKHDAQADRAIVDRTISGLGRLN